jgi:hypothetical protein
VTVGQHSGDSWSVDLFKGQCRFHVKIYEYAVSMDPIKGPFKNLRARPYLWNLFSTIFN